MKRARRACSSASACSRSDWAMTIVSVWLPLCATVAKRRICIPLPASVIYEGPDLGAELKRSATADEISVGENHSALLLMFSGTFEAAITLCCWS